MPIALLTVDQPARNPHVGLGAEDAAKAYAEQVSSTDKLPLMIQGCQLSGGGRQDDKWVGVQFIAPGWVTPGYGTVQMLP